MRRLMPQFMLEVKAMARPLIPPGKISLSTSQGTGGKGRGSRDSKIIKKPLTPRSGPRISALVLPDLWSESRAMCLRLTSSQVGKGSGGTLRKPDNGPQSRDGDLKRCVWHRPEKCKWEGQWVRLPAKHRTLTSVPPGPFLSSRLPLTLEKSNIIATEWVEHNTLTCPACASLAWGKLSRENLWIK